jgi:hypothetical protein
MLSFFRDTVFQLNTRDSRTGPQRFALYGFFSLRFQDQKQHQKHRYIHLDYARDESRSQYVSVECAARRVLVKSGLTS